MVTISVMLGNLCLKWLVMANLTSRESLQDRQLCVLPFLTNMQTVFSVFVRDREKNQLRPDLFLLWCLQKLIYTEILIYTILTFLPIYSSWSSQNPKLGNDLLDFWLQCILLWINPGLLSLSLPFQAVAAWKQNTVACEGIMFNSVNCINPKYCLC